MRSSHVTICVSFVGLLSLVNVSFGQRSDAYSLFPFPHADYSYAADRLPSVGPEECVLQRDDLRCPEYKHSRTSDASPVGEVFRISHASEKMDDRSFPVFESPRKSKSEQKLSSECGTCCEPICCGSPGGWFGSVSALLMTRAKGPSHHFSYDDHPSRNNIPRLDVREAAMELAAGTEIRVGRYFNCGRQAVEFVYWGLYPSRETSVFTAAEVLNCLHPILNFNDLVIGGTGVDAWTNNADAHRVQRSFSIHNVEVNLLDFDGLTCYDSCGRPRFGFSWGAGFRFFHFSEDLMFSAREDGTCIKFDDGQAQIDYLVDVDNNLFGGQIGGEGRWFVSQNLSIILASKVGAFGNSIRHRSRIQDERGRVAVVNNGPMTGAAWDVASHKSEFSVLGEVNLGISYHLCGCFSLTAGYRVVGMSGVAHAADQISTDLRNVNAAYDIDSDNGLLLHGGYIGVEFLH